MSRNGMLTPCGELLRIRGSVGWTKQKLMVRDYRVLERDEKFYHSFDAVAKVGVEEIYYDDTAAFKLLGERWHRCEHHDIEHIELPFRSKNLIVKFLIDYVIAYLLIVWFSFILDKDEKENLLSEIE